MVPEFRIRLGFFVGEFIGPAEALAYPIVLDLGVQAHALQANFRYQMLLGMDVLRHCDLLMLRDGNVRLTPRAWYDVTTTLINFSVIDVHVLGEGKSVYDGKEWIREKPGAFIPFGKNNSLQHLPKHIYILF